jgi:CheY-like chemotaxis protein
MQEKAKQPDFILIDDNEIDLFLHEKIIRLQGLSEAVFSFRSVSQALDYFKRFKRDTDNYPQTVILLDLQLPEMNGFDFLDHFSDMPQTILDKTRVFVLSSTLDHGDLSRSHAHQLVDLILRKPLHPDTLKYALTDNAFA